MKNVYSKDMERKITGIFLKNKDKSLHADLLIEKIQTHYPELESNSIRMKLSNIRALCDEYGVSYKIKVGKLSNYSKQNKEVFIEIIKKLNIL